MGRTSQYITQREQHVPFQHHLHHAHIGRPKDQQKRVQILEGAAYLFLQDGYSLTSMDTIAKHAGVSKQTVYSHFKSKAELFKAVIDNKCREYELDTTAYHDSTTSIETKLLALAEHFVALMHDEMVVAMYAVVIAESKTNPEVAELFYTAGPQQATDMLQAQLQLAYPQLSPRTVADLSYDFFNLLKGDYHMKSILGLSSNMSKVEQQEYAHAGCQKFIAILHSISG